MKFKNVLTLIGVLVVIGAIYVVVKQKGVIGGVDIPKMVSNTMNKDDKNKPNPEVEKAMKEDFTALGETRGVILDPQGGSKNKAQVELVDTPAGLRVKVTTVPVPEGKQQDANIHKGTCQAVGDVAFALNPIKNGESITIIEGKTVNDLRLEDHYIGIHPEEAADGHTHDKADSDNDHVACGNI